MTRAYNGSYHVPVLMQGLENVRHCQEISYAHFSQFFFPNLAGDFVHFMSNQSLKMPHLVWSHNVLQHSIYFRRKRLFLDFAARKKNTLCRPGCT